MIYYKQKPLSLQQDAKKRNKKTATVGNIHYIIIILHKLKMTTSITLTLCFIYMS